MQAPKPVAKTPAAKAPAPKTPAPKKPAPKKSLPPADPTHPRDLNSPINAPVQVTRLRFSPDGKVLAAAGFDAAIHRWDVTGETPTELPPITGHNGWVTALVFGQDRLYSADSWGKLIASDATAKTLWTIEAHDGWLRSLALSPDGSTLATASRDGFVRLWSAKDGAKLGEFTAESDPMAVEFTPDGKSLLVGVLHGLVQQINVATRAVERTLEVKETYLQHRIQEVGGVRQFAFDPKGKTLAVAGAVPSTGGFVQCTPLVAILDFATGKRLHTLKGESEKEGYITDLCWHPSGDYFLATTSGQPGNGKILFWKPAEAKPFFIGAKPNCHSLALQPDARKLAVAATNANSSGNGRPKNKDGSPDYPNNNSPIHVFEMPGAKV